MTDRPVRPPEDVSPELLRQTVDAIDALVRESLPRAWDRRDGAVITWPTIAAGLIARANYMLGSLATMVEERRNADGLILLRVLFEHAVTFLWIATEPDPKVETWRRWDDWRRIKLHRDAAALGVKVLSESELKELGEPPRPVDLASQAATADRYWAERDAAFRADGPLSLRGMYTALYRRASGLVHSTQAGVERHLRVTESQTVVLPGEQTVLPPDLLALGVPMIGLMLIANGHLFGWPEERKVRDVTEALFYE